MPHPNICRSVNVYRVYTAVMSAAHTAQYLLNFFSSFIFWFSLLYYAPKTISTVESIFSYLHQTFILFNLTFFQTTHVKCSLPLAGILAASFRFSWGFTQRIPETLIWIAGVAAFPPEKSLQLLCSCEPYRTRLYVLGVHLIFLKMKRKEKYS